MEQTYLADVFAEKLYSEEKENHELETQLRASIDSNTSAKSAIKNPHDRKLKNLVPEGPAAKPAEYFYIFWLPIKMEILPSIKSWLDNLFKLESGAESCNDVLSKEIKYKLSSLKLKILDILSKLAAITRNRQFKKLLFLDDKDLRKYIHAM